MNGSAGEGPVSDELIARLGRTTVAAWGRYTTRSGGRVLVDKGVTFLVGSDPTPLIINTVFRTDPSVSPGTVLDRGRALYESIGHGFTLVTSDHSDGDLDQAAAAADWQVAIELPVMIRRERIADRPLPAGASLRRVDPGDDLDSFRAIQMDGFAGDDDERAGAAVVFAGSESIAAEDTVAMLAAVDGRDAAAAMVDVIAGIGYVGWVGTLPELRRRGLGELVTRAVTNAAFDLGAEIVTLGASPMGLPLYASMGYETVGLERIWVPPPA